MSSILALAAVDRMTLCVCDGRNTGGWTRPCSVDINEKACEEPGWLEEGSRGDGDWVILYVRLLRLCRESQLPPGFVDDHGDRIGEIQTPAVGLHRYPYTLRVGKGFEQIGRQSSRFGAKQ